MTLLGGVGLLALAVAVYFSGYIWYWPWVLGLALVIAGLLQLAFSRPSAVEKEFLDPDFERRPFLFQTGAFPDQLGKLAARSPLFTPGLVQSLLDAHGGLAGDESHEQTVMNPDRPREELLRIKLQKLADGKTSLVLRGRKELMDLLSENARE